MRQIRFAAVAALLVAVASCGDSTAPGTPNTELAAARARWRAQNLHTYAFILQRTCFCANTDRLYVAVLADTVAEVIDFDSGEAVDRGLGQTVDDLFAFIQSAQDRGVQLIRADFDGVKGFPTSIDYDGAAQIADDELSIRVSDVNPITPQQP